jgi:hypothetical protein
VDDRAQRSASAWEGGSAPLDKSNDVPRRTGVPEIAHASGEGVGATYRQLVNGPGGRKIPADFEITHLEPNQRLDFQTIAGPVRPRGTFTFAGERRRA